MVYYFDSFKNLYKILYLFNNLNYSYMVQKNHLDECLF